MAIVTGGSSGLGESLSKALAAAGARVAVVARRRERLASLATVIDGLAISCDLTDPDQPGRVVQEVAETLGPPEILVNVAGNIFSNDKAEDEPLDAVLKTLQLNLVAPFRLSQEVFQHMTAVGRGSIVNISSISGHVGVPGIPQASYAASKLGLTGLTAELAVQWAKHSIRINTVAPGFFRSEMTAGLYDGDRGQRLARAQHPAPVLRHGRRLCGRGALAGQRCRPLRYGPDDRRRRRVDRQVAAGAGAEAPPAFTLGLPFTLGAFFVDISMTTVPEVNAGPGAG